MSIGKGSSKQCTSTSIPRSIKRSSHRGISAAHSRTNQSSSSCVNASWDHYDASCNHAEEQTIDRPGRKERLLKSPRSINDSPFRPKKNMLLENDLELKLLLQQLHESTEFMGTINPLHHSHYLSPNTTV